MKWLWWGRIARMLFLQFMHVVTRISLIVLMVMVVYQSLMDLD